MTALAYALEPPADLRSLAEVSMSPDQAAFYIQQLKIPFGKRKLCEARAGLCDGPPFHQIGRKNVVYFKTEVDEWARKQFPSRVLINPWGRD